MPTYDYHCQACEHQFTAIHKIMDSPPKCPECGGEVSKLISAPAVHGSGQKAEASFQGHGCGAGACGCKH